MCSSDLSSPDIIWPLLNGGDMMTKVLGAEGAGEQYHKISIEPRFVRAMFTAIDNNGDGPKEDAVAYTLMKQINFSYVNKDKEFMQRILKEVAEIMNGSSSSTFRPGTPEFDKLLLTIENLVNHISVK